MEFGPGGKSQPPCSAGYSRSSVERFSASAAKIEQARGQDNASNTSYWFLLCKIPAIGSALWRLKDEGTLRGILFASSRDRQLGSAHKQGNLMEHKCFISECVRVCSHKQVLVEKTARLVDQFASVTATHDVMQDTLDQTFGSINSQQPQSKGIKGCGCERALD